MIVRTRIFDLCKKEYSNLSELAHAMGISVSQIYRVQAGERQINQKFIVGAIRAFPDYTLDDLFYLAPALPTVNNNGRRRQRPAANSRKKTAPKESQTRDSISRTR